MNTSFEWDDKKNLENLHKHQVNFQVAQYAFIDPKRIIAEDTVHSREEKRYYCFGKVKGGVLTVRFTYRNNSIRIIGAGYWRKGKNIYEKHNKIQQ
ncbi:MAG: BrnT family toxin [Patescibacteria group bacterium]